MKEYIEIRGIVNLEFNGTIYFELKNCKSLSLICELYGQSQQFSEF